MKVKIEKQAMAAPSRSMPRSASATRSDAPPPFSSNPAHHPVSTPTTPVAARSCMMADTPPATPKDKGKAAAAAASLYASWSPRKFMQRAARAFRGGRSRRRRMDLAGAGDELSRADSCKVSIARAAIAVSTVEAEAAAGNNAAHDNGGAAVRAEEEHHRPDEVVPEKIIHETNHHAPAAVPAAAAAEEECVKPAEEEKEATGAVEAVAEEDPKKAASPAPEAVAVAGAEDIADKFVTVVKEAIKKHEEDTVAADGKDNEKAEAMRRFQGSRVRTAMEARPESELPRRREAARSRNDVIEEARSKLLEMRQCNRVKALVGAFETVMDAKQDAAAGGTPRHHYRKSA